MVQSGCVVFKIHVSHGLYLYDMGKKIKHLSKYWRVVNTGRPLQVKYCGGGVATHVALTPMRNSSVDTIQTIRLLGLLQRSGARVSVTVGWQQRGALVR